jgi:hypothetical protein
MDAEYVQRLAAALRVTSCDVLLERGGVRAQKMSSGSSATLMDEYEYVMHGRVFKYVDR